MIGTDHIAVLAKDSSHVTTLLFHNSDAFTAVQIKNQLIATHITLHTNFHIFNHNQAIFNFINHHNMYESSVIIPCMFTALITLTSTVDILTAKQTIAGEKIIPIKFQTVKYFNNSKFFSFSPHPKASIKTIAGDNIIAIQIIPILIRNTTSIAIKGIHMAIV